MSDIQWITLSEMPRAIDDAFKAALGRPALTVKDRQVIHDKQLNWQHEMLKVLFEDGVTAPVSKCFAEAYFAAHIYHAYYAKDGKYPDLKRSAELTPFPRVVEYTIYSAAIGVTEKVALAPTMTADTFAIKAVRSLVKPQYSEVIQLDPIKLAREVVLRHDTSNAYMRQVLEMEHKLINQTRDLAQQEHQILVLHNNAITIGSEAMASRSFIHRHTVDNQVLVHKNVELLNNIAQLNSKLAGKEAEVLTLRRQMIEKDSKITSLISRNKDLEDETTHSEDETSNSENLSPRPDNAPVPASAEVPTDHDFIDHLLEKLGNIYKRQQELGPPGVAGSGGKAVKFQDVKDKK